MPLLLLPLLLAASEFHPYEYRPYGLPGYWPRNTLVEAEAPSGPGGRWVHLDLFAGGDWESVEYLGRHVTGRHAGHLSEAAVVRASELVDDFCAEVESNGWVEAASESDPRGLSSVRTGSFQSHERRGATGGPSAPYRTLFEGLEQLLASSG